MSVFCFFWISDILENDMTHTEYVKKGIKWQQQQCEATLCVRWCLTTKTLSLSLFVTLTSLSWHLALWNLICFNSSCLEVLDILFLTWIFFGPNVIQLISNISVSYNFWIKQIKCIAIQFSLFLIQECISRTYPMFSDLTFFMEVEVHWNEGLVGLNQRLMFDLAFRFLLT